MNIQVTIETIIYRVFKKTYIYTSEQPILVSGLEAHEGMLGKIVSITINEGNAYVSVDVEGYLIAMSAEDFAKRFRECKSKVARSNEK